MHPCCRELEMDVEKIGDFLFRFGYKRHGRRIDVPLFIEDTMNDIRCFQPEMNAVYSLEKESKMVTVYIDKSSVRQVQAVARSYFKKKDREILDV